MSVLAKETCLDADMPTAYTLNQYKNHTCSVIKGGDPRESQLHATI